MRDSLYTNAQGLDFLREDALKHTPLQFLYQKPHTVVTRQYEGVEAHTLPASKDSCALTVSLKPVAVHGTSVSFSAFSLLVRQTD